MVELKTRSLQLAFFVVSVEGLRADDFYRSMFKTDPDTVLISKPTPQDPTLSYAAGQFRDLDVDCRVQVGRVDVTFAKVLRDPATGEPMGPDEFDLAHGLDCVRERLGEKAVSLPKTIRLALIGTLVEAADSLASTQLALAELIGVDLHPDDGYTDLSFSLNRRAKLVPGVEFNRLLRYACTANQLVQFQLGPAGTVSQVTTGDFHLQLLVDINTVPSNIVFSGAEALPIMDAMSAELARIASSGRLTSITE